MKHVFYRLASLTALVATLAGCSKERLADAPAPSTAVSANSYAGSDFSSYQQYTTLPEQMIYVTGGGGSTYGSSQYYRTPLALGKATIAGGHQIYSYTPRRNNGTLSATAGVWQPLSGPRGGGVIKIVNAAYTARMYAITDQNELWKFDAGSWSYMGVAATDVAINYDSSISQYDIFYLDTSNVYGGHRIYRLVADYPVQPALYTSQEVTPGAAATSLALDERRKLWVTNSLHEIFVNSSPRQGGGFTLLQGQGVAIACDGDGAVGLLGTKFLTYGYELFLGDTQGGSFPWKLQYGEATAIGGDELAHGFYVTNTLGEVFYLSY